MVPSNLDIYRVSFLTLSVSPQKSISDSLFYPFYLCRYPHIEKDHLVKLMKQLLLGAAAPQGMVGGNALNAAAVPTLLGTGSFSLLGSM